jgi:signal transduction histidine kinase/CheY-like chemotaxis protein
MSDSPSTSPASLVQDLRYDAFARAIVPSAFGLWFIVALSFWFQGTQAIGLLTVGMIAFGVGVCAVHVVEHHYAAGALLLLLAYILVGELGIRPLAPVLTQYFYILLPIMATALFGPLGGALATILSAAIITLHAWPLNGEEMMLLFAGPLWIVITTGLASWQSSEGLRTACSWAWDAYEQAQRKTEEAQARRAELLRVSKDLAQANDRLQRLNRYLKIARREADEARRVKAQFAANISHELRTPLNLLVGFGQMLLTAPEFYGNVSLSPAYMADVMVVYRNARHLLSLVDDVLELSQLESGNMVIQPEFGDVHGVIREAVEATRALFDRRGLAITLDLSAHLPRIMLDKARIRQVLINLLANAARYTERGGVTIRTGQEAGHVWVSVIDTGVGIAEEQQRRAFQPFQQLDSAEGRRSDGVGLGLAISRHFVELHGGRIGLESVPGQGSTFTFSLPLLEAEGEAGELVRIADLDPSPLLERQEVVLLESDTAVVNLFRRHLGEMNVLRATSLSDAEEVVRARGPLALVADSRQFPAEAMEAWQERLGEQAVAVIGCPMPSGRRLARVQGIDELLVKPVLPEELARALRQLPGEVRRVLLADAEADMVRLLERMIREDLDNVRIYKAYDAAELADLVQAHAPDVLLVDLLMLGEDVPAGVAALRQLPGVNGAALMVTSDRADLDALAPAAQREFYLLRPQPAEPLATVRCVERLIGQLANPTQPAADPAPRAVALG